MQAALNTRNANDTLRIGDKALFVTIVNTPRMTHIYRSQGLILKIKDDRATLKFRDGRASTILLKSLCHGGPSNELSRAFSRRAARRGQRVL